MIARNEVVTPERVPGTAKRQEHGTPQVRLLSRIIEAVPDAPVNFLLRGEEWLVCGQFEKARADFAAARVRSERYLAQSAWGYIYQAYLDRADAGLRLCEAAGGEH